MADDSLENIFAYAERAYIRMQAGDVLVRCLEDASVTPMQQMVETLVLSGPDSLEVLREILAETNKRKIQVNDDLDQVLTGFKSSLDGYGVRLLSLRKPAALVRMRPVRFLGILRAQGIVQEEAQTRCLQLLKDSRELVLSLQQHYHLLASLEKYLEDWMWGMFYHTVRQPDNPDTSPPIGPLM